MATIKNDQPVTAKVIREFYFKSDDAPKSQKPKKYPVGSSIEMTGLEYRIHSSTNRVCLPNEYDEMVKKYQKPKPQDGQGAKGK